MTRGEKIGLEAMKTEFKRLSAIATNLEKEATEATNIGEELLAIHEEFAEIVKSGNTGKSVLNKLDELVKRSKKADRIQKKDIVDLFNRESEAKINRDSLGHEISMLEYRYDLRSM